MSDGKDDVQMVKERDFYLALLELHHTDDAEAFLDRALALVVGMTGAQHGYLALGEGAVDASDPNFSASLQLSPEGVEQVRQRISSGIMARALGTGKVIQTNSAVDDPRFVDSKSVQQNTIQAVLCAPIGALQALGVIYLQGADKGRFDRAAERCVELFAHQVAPIARRLCQSLAPPAADPTAPYRERLPHTQLVGTSPASAQLLQQVSCVAPLDVDILLSGPTGTGKTATARTIWQHSRRSSAPFIEVNCAAIPEALFESEMFGAEKGAHSTATRDNPGKIAAADGGTLFLDEVVDCPLTGQAKLLQFLQSRQYFPLGSSTAKTADVRVIAASNRDLASAVREGRFREDLLFRLQVVPIALPPLSARLEDVPLLAESFCERYATRYGLAGARLSPGAREALTATNWPGNVRQLENVVHAAVIRGHAEGIAQIEARHCFPEDADADAATLQSATKAFQRQFIEQRLRSNDWNIKATAATLDITRSHLYNLISAHGLERD